MTNASDAPDSDPNGVLSGRSSAPVRQAFDGVRLHVVTGKGGTGKTTAAAGLALALAGSGRRVLLCEVEDRQGFSRLFDVPALSYTEQRLTTSRAGGQVFALAVEPRAALMDYLDTFYVLGSRAGKILDGLGAVDFATTIAPGLRDVLLTGKVYEAAKRVTKGRGGAPGVPVYDAVVLDAPPTGRVAHFLNVSAQVSGLAKVGPIHKQAESMRRMLHAPTTRVHMVTLLEDMPVQEASDGLAELSSLGLPLGSVIVNRVQPEHFSSADLTRLRAGGVAAAELVPDLRLAGVATSASSSLEQVASGLLTAGSRHAERVAIQDEQWARVAHMQRPILQLPQLNVGVDRGTIHDIAEAFSHQGVGA